MKKQKYCGKISFHYTLCCFVLFTPNRSVIRINSSPPIQRVLPTLTHIFPWFLIVCNFLFSHSAHVNHQLFINLIPLFQIKKTRIILHVIFFLKEMHNILLPVKFEGAIKSKHCYIRRAISLVLCVKRIQRRICVHDKRHSGK